MSRSIEILIFAVLAAYIFFRLWGVLGRRTGQERKPPDPNTWGMTDVSDTDTHQPTNNVISLHGGDVPETEESLPILDAAKKGLESLIEEDPTFDPYVFLDGAQAAFSMIVEAFAEGNREDLKTLLGESAYNSFNSALDQREAAKETVETEIHDMTLCEIQEISVKDGTANITVKFVSEQITVTKDAEDRIIDNPAHLTLSITDIWTFSRNIRSENPNWILTGTRIEGS